MAALGRDFLAPGMAEAKAASIAAEFHRASASGSERTSIPIRPMAHRAASLQIIARLPLSARICPACRSITNSPNARRVSVAGPARRQTTGFTHLPAPLPPKPGLVRDPKAGGRGIEVEIWSLPLGGFADFVERIPEPLGIGKITLEDGRKVSGFLCEAVALDGATDITAHAGWKNYLASKAAERFDRNAKGGLARPPFFAVCDTGIN